MLASLPTFSLSHSVIGALEQVAAITVRESMMTVEVGVGGGGGVEAIFGGSSRRWHLRSQATAT